MRWTFEVFVDKMTIKVVLPHVDLDRFPAVTKPTGNLLFLAVPYVPLSHSTSSRQGPKQQIEHQTRKCVPCSPRCLRRLACVFGTVNCHRSASKFNLRTSQKKYLADKMAYLKQPGALVPGVPFNHMLGDITVQHRRTSSINDVATDPRANCMDAVRGPETLNALFEPEKLLRAIKQLSSLNSQLRKPQMERQEAHQGHHHAPLA